MTTEAGTATLTREAVRAIAAANGWLHIHQASSPTGRTWRASADGFLHDLSREGMVRHEITVWYDATGKVIDGAGSDYTHEGSTGFQFDADGLRAAFNREL